MDLYPLWAPSLEENGPIIPKWTEKTLRKALVEGECEFWDVLCPGFAPNPFLYSSGFGVSLLGLFLVWSLVASMEAFAWLLALL